MDIIHIVDLEVHAHHGVFPEENVLGQKFLVSLDLSVDTREAAATDDLTKSVDYGSVCKVVVEIMTAQTYQLIETVAERIAQGVLDRFELIQGVAVEVKKPWAPIGLPLSYVSVQIHRTRTE